MSNFSWNFLSYYDAIGNRLLVEPQKVIESEQSTWDFCKELVESNTNAVAAMVEYRPGLIKGHDKYFAPSYVGGKFVDQASLPLEDRIWPGRALNDSIWLKGWKVFVEGPVYSTACGCRILTTSLIRFDSEGMFAIFTIASNFDKEIEYLKEYNPYPEGEFYVIGENDNFYVNNEFDIPDVSARQWLGQKYGDAALKVLDQTMEDGEVHCSNIDKEEMYFFSAYVPDAEFYFLYAIPREFLLSDVKNVFSKILLVAIIGAILITIVCVLNIYFFGKIRARESAIEKELETAAKIQMSMLTHPSDTGSCCEVDARLLPAKHVGGDLYCYFRNDGKLYFCIGDVAGKGIPAAMHMSKCISLFRNISRYCHDAASLVFQLNEEMCADNSECIFVSVFVGILDLATGELDYCNAGHERPLYWSGISGEKPRFVELVSENIVLGVEQGFKFKTGRFTMQKGSVLMQFTDGVDEATDDRMHLFGKNRFIDAFSDGLGSPIIAINNLVISRIKKFVGNHQQSDDITLFTIRYNGEA